MANNFYHAMEHNQIDLVVRHPRLMEQRGSLTVTRILDCVEKDDESAICEFLAYF
jgi:hypothetical protein